MRLLSLSVSLAPLALPAENRVPITDKSAPGRSLIVEQSYCSRAPPNSSSFGFLFRRCDYPSYIIRVRVYIKTPTCALLISHSAQEAAVADAILYTSEKIKSISLYCLP